MKDWDRKIIYLHGFNSAGKPYTPKLQHLATLGEVIILNYNSFDTYHQILKDLKQKFKETIRSSKYTDWAVAGTSLGGFWAATLGSAYGVPAILINPSIDPSKTLKTGIGKTFQNFVSGEKAILTRKVVESYPKIPLKGALLILIDEGDEILDHAQTKEYYSTYNVVLFEGGSHRFEHMKEAIPHIEKFFIHIQTTI